MHPKDQFAFGGPVNALHRDDWFGKTNWLGDEKGWQ
jgi:hypothetical protein